MVRVWYINEKDVTEDQRNPSIDEVASLEKVKEIGVEYFNIDADTHETNGVFGSLKEVRGYDYSDVITVSRNTLQDYDKKIKSFFEEHLHTDEEIRFILDGSGYFDVRDVNDRWIRIEMNKNDLIVLPAGIYHRFTLDKKDYIKAMRLFKGEPVWTPHNRPADDMQQRKNYIQKFGVKTQF